MRVFNIIILIIIIDYYY